MVLDKEKLSVEERKDGLYKWVDGKKSNPIFVITGDKGVGKTTLLSKFLEIATLVIKRLIKLAELLH